MKLLRWAAALAAVLVMVLCLGTFGSADTHTPQLFAPGLAIGMVASRKRGAEQDAAKSDAQEQDDGQEEPQGDGSTVKLPQATDTPVPVYRTDLGEALPPQKPAGVE